LDVFEGKMEENGNLFYSFIPHDRNNGGLTSFESKSVKKISAVVWSRDLSNTKKDN